MNSEAFVRLGDIVEGPPRRGTRQSEDGDGDIIPFIDTRLVSEGPGKLANAPQERSVSNGRVRNTRMGDLLLVSRGLTEDRPVGCAVVAFTEPAAFSASLTRVRLDPSRANPDYVRLYLTSSQGREALVAASTGAVVNNLRPSSLAEVEIKLPSLSEQEAIVEIVTGLEGEMAKVEAARVTLEAVHETLREGLITGVLEVADDPKVRSG